MDILLVEDDKELNQTIEKYLNSKGFKVYPCFDTECAKEILKKHHIDLILLDVKLPKESGFEFLENNNISIPTIYITSLNSVEDIERGFKSGAVEYIKKPFYLKELLLRIEALFKKDEIKIDKNCYFDTKLNLIIKDDKKFHISPKEAEVLQHLIKHKDKIVPLEQLILITNTKAALRTYIKNLRKIFSNIKTVKDVGYKFVSGD